MIRPLKFPKVAPTTTFENPEVAKRPLGVDYKGLFGLVMMQILDTHRTDGDIAMRKLVGSRVPEVYHIARCASDTFKVSKTFKKVAMREAPHRTVCFRHFLLALFLAMPFALHPGLNMYQSRQIDFDASSLSRL